jgi:hypothetical protein
MGGQNYYAPFEQGIWLQSRIESLFLPKLRRSNCIELERPRQADLDRIAVAFTVWGDLFNRPVCGFVQSGKKRE